jgi:hypothetical protein
MILLDNHLVDLASGYERACKANLQSRWRHRLLATYTRRRGTYDVAQARRRQQVADFKPKVAIGLAVACCLFLSGMLLDDASLRVSLRLAGLVGGGLLAIGWLWKTVILPPKPPRHPLQEPLRSRLFPPLLPLWRERLRGQLPTHPPYEGFVGESHFVKRLQNLRSNPSYIIYRLQQRPGDDVDVTVVGPRGVWVFEVKYWSGTIDWRDGKWLHEKSYYRRGGIRVTETLEIGQPPDEQWRRMADDVAETLRRRAPGLVARVPALIQVKGGLVFTHPRATYQIARDCPCAWGTVDFWVRQLAGAPAISGVNEHIVLHILDVLLARHRQVSGGRIPLSLDTCAKQLIQEAEARLVEWMQD